jgi:hypothetical protein
LAVRRSLIVTPASFTIAALLLAVPALARAAEPAVDRAWTATVYGARMSAETGWEDILIDPFEAQYVDVYMLAGALSRPYASARDGALTFEAEGQVVRYFGDQDHWEFNAVPVTLRWHRFPWSGSVATSAAFGLGVSYATELPPVEVAIEGGSAKWLIYWLLEATAGRAGSPWSFTLRMHHRSVAYGLMAKDGGMNGVGVGVRYRFGARERRTESQD